MVNEKRLFQFLIVNTQLTINCNYLIINNKFKNFSVLIRLIR